MIKREEIDKDQKLAVVLFNFGAPSSIEDIFRYQVSLFSDRDVIKLPCPWITQKLFAHFIASLRKNKSIEKYKKIGGKSPLMELSEFQRSKLETLLRKDLPNLRVFLAMKYSSPSISECLEKLAKLGYKKLIFLPLFPQYSRVTTGGFYSTLKKKIPEYNFDYIEIDEYYKHPKFIEAWKQRIEEKLSTINDPSKCHMIFSAHSVPMKLIEEGDPYKEQTEISVSEIYKTLKTKVPYTLAYQSRSGPVKWLEPGTKEVLLEQARLNHDIIMIPISFILDNFETVYEEDIEFRELFEQEGGGSFHRVEALNDHKTFLLCMRDLVLNNAQKFRRDFS